MGTEDERDDRTDIGDEIEQQSASTLPKREAMSMIAPPPLSGVLKAGPTDAATTDQGIDESDPSTDA
jgi:hypothetical protein